MSLKLFVVLLGANVGDRNIEQHDVCFCISETLEDSYPDIIKFWPKAKTLHIDAYMCVEQIGDYAVIVPNKIVSKNDGSDGDDPKLFFINLGGYIKGVFEELHKKILVVAPSKEKAVSIVKKDPFFTDGKLLQDKHCPPHVDDKHQIGGATCDEVFDVNSVLDEDIGFNIVLKKVRENSDVYPEVVILGYHKIKVK